MQNSDRPASYLFYWHRPYASINSPHCSPVKHSDLVEAEQLIRSDISPQARPHPPKQCLLEGVGEVRVYLFGKADVFDH